MSRGDRRAGWFAVLMGLCLAGGQTWRAATQSITHDEALNYLRYLSKPWGEVFSSFTANHHFLFTYLAKVSVGVFGVSEFAMRLPSLVAFAIFAVSVGVLARRMCRHWLLFLAAFSFLLLNPLILDFLCAARGYGLALAFFTVTLCLSHAALTAEAVVCGRQKLRIGVSAALCLGANLAFAPALVGLGCSNLALDIAQSEGRGMGRILRCVRSWAVTALLPAVLILAALIALPMRYAQRSHFFFGAESLRDTMRGLVQASFDHGGRATFAVEPTALVGFVGDFLCPALLVVVAVSAALNWALRKRAKAVLFSTSLAIAVLTVVALHVLVDAAYPMERTGLYFIPLLGFALVEVVGQFRQNQTRLVLPGLLAALLLAASAVFVAQFQVEYFRNWKYDAGAKRVVERILADAGENKKGRVRVALMDWRYGPSMVFYQQNAADGAIAPISHKWTFGDFTFDYYLVPPLLAADDDESEYLSLFYKDPVSGIVVGVNKK